jgi:DNA repair exonuclease SbcCD ATPase subunit
MSIPSVRIRDLEVQRMPGIPAPGFALATLVDGVNVIHGRNGAGKTTTAKAIEILLCPAAHEDRDAANENRNAMVAGSFDLGGDRYQVSVQAGRAECSRNGERVEMPELGPRENRSRYRLALHDLLQKGDRQAGDRRKDDEGFAKAVLAASHGGFDIAAAADELDFRKEPAGTRTLRLDVDKALQHYREATARQQAVEAQERELASLERERGRFGPARQGIELLNAAEALVSARSELAALEERLKAYDERLSRFRGDEKETIDACVQRRVAIEETIHEASAKLDDARARLRNAGLPESGLTLAQVEEWRARCAGLREIEQAIEAHGRAIESARKKMAGVRAQIPGGVTDEQLAQFGPAREDELAEFARQAEDVRGRMKAVEHRASLLGDPQEHAPTEQLREALRILGCWMRSSPAAVSVERRSYVSVILSGAVILVLAAILAIVVHWGWILAALLALLPWLIQVVMQRRASGAVDRRAVHRDEFLRTGVEGPPAWTEEAVAETIDRLAHELAEASLEEERTRERKALESTRQELARLQADLDRRRDETTSRIGIEPRCDDVWLHAIVNAVSRWQAASAEAASVQAAMGVAEREYDGQRRALHRALAEYEGGAIGDSYVMARRIQEINARREMSVSARQEIESAERSLAQAQNERDRVQGEYERVFTSLDLAAGDEKTLLAWLEQKPEFDDLTRRVFAARQKVHDAERPLDDHREMMGWPLEQIRGEREQLEEQLAKEPGVLTRIGEIQHAVRMAKEGCDLTDALKARDDALEAMRGKRDEEEHAIVGHLLVEFIARKAAENRPAVFTEARLLLGRITNERLRLDFDERDGGSFRAYDNTAARHKALDELSSGERLQLLLAVRLAFVELQEQELSGRLPLLIDEALANSDDERAGAIIDAVIEIARTGRQVFYFTAQLDEVAKWRERLAQADAPHHVLDLDEIRRRAGVKAHPLLSPAAMLPVPSPPDALTREEYANALHVPGIDPWAPDARPVHLWHLIDDLDALYLLLRHRIETWGQYEQLALHGGLKTERDRTTYDRAAARAAVIDVALRAWQTGRARPIDGSHLHGADGVSPRMFDRVAELLARVGGDAKALIQSLRTSGVAHWHDANTDRLEDFLIREGHISQQDPLTSDQISARVVAAVRSQLDAGLVDQLFIDRILGELSRSS